MCKLTHRDSSNAVLLRLGIIIGLTAFLPIPTFWYWWVPREVKNLTALYSAWNKEIRSYEEERYQQRSSLPTDLFWDNAKAYNVKNHSIYLQALQDTQHFFSTQYASCQLSIEELSSILFFTNAEFAKEIRNQLRASWLPKDREYTRVCTKITACIEGYTDKNLNKGCDVLVNEAFLLGIKSHQQKLKVEESNLWKDRYQNWNKEDSAYDLLVDISKIGEIFFQEIKTSPEILFYRLPNFKTNDKKQGATEVKSPIPNWWQVSTGGDMNWSQLQPHWSLPKDELNKSPKSNFPLTEDPEISQFIQQKEIKSQNKDAEVAFVNYCIVGNELESQNSAFTNLSMETHALELSDQVVSNYINAILTNTNSLKEMPTHLKQPSKFNETSLSTQESVVDAVKKQLESCVKKCEALAFDERAVCKLQCLCAEYTSPRVLKDAKFHFLEEGALRARICTIPSRTMMVDTKTKKLLSIEAILREIQNVIEGLYDSWELTTKTRVREILDSSQAKFDFWKNISFIIGIWTKEPTTTPHEKQLQNAEIHFLESLRNAKINPNDRNRYAIMENYQLLKSQRSVQSHGFVPNKDTLPVSTSLSLSQDKINTQNHLISNFLDQNIVLLYKMNETFKDMDQALQALWLKKK